MKRIYTKLFLTVMALVLSATMVVSACYAWLVISQSPAVDGISVMIGGGKTILLAADLTKTVVTADGSETVVHYPGSFTDTLRFSEYEGYEALSISGMLAPVSTADGISWIIPQYGENGALLETKDFQVDSTLEYANGEQDGRYVYLDFWMVSPGSAYDVRVSMDKQSMEGSFLVELPNVEEDKDGGYTLAQSQNIVSASARVGFLVSEANAGDDALSAYLISEGYDDRYKTLQGVYQEPGTAATEETRFTIYEPNGTLHPAGEDTSKDGSYIVTRPLRYDAENGIVETDIVDCLSVQQPSAWKTAPVGSTAEAVTEPAEESTLETAEESTEESAAKSSDESTQTTMLEQILQTAIVGQELSLGKARDKFLSYLRGQEGAYLSAGLFVKDTAVLYAAADVSGGTVTAEAVQSMETAGASDGAVIARLTRNTPQRVRMYIWLEGQDADCQNDSAVDLTSIALKIELAGSTP